MNKRTVSLFLLFCCWVGTAQNLLKNPSFEEYNHLPDLKYEFGDGYENYPFICKNWHMVYRTSPDYYHINAKHKKYLIPHNSFGFHPVINDSAYIGFVPFDLMGATEPISGEFKEPLEAGKLYEISFMYRFAGVNSYFYLDRLECMIGDDISRLRNNMLKGNSDYERIVTPDVKANVAFEDSLNNDGEWNKMKGYYLAKGGERFITFGFFYQTDKLKNIISEYVSSNFVLGQNPQLEDRFFKKYRKYISFIHRNPSYGPKIEAERLEVTFEEKAKTSNYVYQQRISYYFIDDVSVVKEK
jgi:hypothetical protein